MPQSKAVLTDQDIAALAAGATPEAIALAWAAVEAAGGDKAELEALAKTALETAAKAEADAKLAADAKIAADAKLAADKLAETAAKAGQGELVTFLQAQLKEKEAALTEAAIQRKAQDEKLAGIESTHTALLDIAKVSIGRMQVALGGSASDLTTLAAVAVLAEHKRVSDAFQAKFKVGGVAAVPAQAASGTKVVSGAALHTARVNATRSTKKS